MPAIAWTPTWSVGHEKLDEQHQQLLEMYNRFDAAAARGRGWRELGLMMADFEDYTRWHFSYEEGLLAEAGYADLPRHRALHRQLERKLAAFRKELEADRRVTAQFRKFLGYWWQNHILDHDLDYGKTLFEVAVGTDEK